jgi:hypothetical protein
MNATTRHGAWNWMGPRWKKRRQLGFALYEAGRRPGVPGRVANAHARFEYEARQARGGGGADKGGVGWGAGRA